MNLKLHDPENEPDFSAFIGMDWGDKSHAIALYNPHSKQTESSLVPQSAETLHAWLDQMETRFGGKPVALAIEGTRGAVFPVLLGRQWLHVFSVHPATSSRFRTAFAPSGAKDDEPDAQVLLKILRCHRDQLRVLSLDDFETRLVGGLCEARRGAVDQRTQLCNRLTACLKKYYPQALELVGEHLDSPMALEFLEQWPDLFALKKARSATLTKFFYDHNVRSPKVVEARLKLIEKARPLTADPVILSISVSQMRLFVAQLHVVQEHIERFESQIATAFKAHPDAALFSQLPGAGKVMAPRLLAAFGADRERFPSPESLQKYAGLAPVREKSGGSLWTHWRWHAPTFLRQTFVEWAGQTVVYCAWAKAYYKTMKAKGKTHWVILRSLAFKWIRILWKCWKERTPYNDELYQKQLEKRNSPLAKILSEKLPNPT